MEIECDGQECVDIQCLLIAGCWSLLLLLQLNVLLPVLMFRACGLLPGVRVGLSLASCGFKALTL